ncbi:MAG: hypothetical protein CM1200mP39_20220 [Dehalococcoidia bacterium]|nr:MAG: hypothetical protein CM1200mP39_20220 [Dehalococcoidia bacterium]
MEIRRQKKTIERNFRKNEILEAFGGGPLLGVKGLAIVGHGSSGVDAVANAIGTAKYVIGTGLMKGPQSELDRIRIAINN